MKAFRILAAGLSVLALLAAPTAPVLAAPFTAIVQKDGVTPVDPTNGLPVNCVSGCVAGTGTASNATSAQASSSTNGQTNAWLYGWNGASWDQILVDGSKFLKVNCAAGCAGGTASNATSAQGTSSTNGQTNAWLYGFNGSTWDQLQVDGSKNLKAVIGAALPTGGNVIGGVTQSGTWNIGTITTLPSLPTGANAIGSITNTGFNITGTLPAYTATPTFNLGTLNGAALDASVTGLQVAQGSTTAAQKGGLMLGAVTTAAPTYTTGQTSAVSLDTAGNVRITCVSGCGGSGGTASAYAAAFPANGTAIGVKNGANMVNLTADGSSNLNVNCAVGCSAGALSNASSGVATTSTNSGANSYNYGFNGTTWDQLQVDASKFLKTVVSAALPTGANVIGAVTQSGTWNVGTVTSITNALPAGTNTLGAVLPVPTSASANGITPVVSAATEACHVLKASAGNLYSVTLATTASAGASDWVLVTNTTTAPADGAVTPLLFGRIGPNGVFSWGAPGGIPMVFSTGITVCLSSTGPTTKTADAQAAISGMTQ